MCINFRGEKSSILLYLATVNIIHVHCVIVCRIVIIMHAPMDNSKVVLWIVSLSQSEAVGLREGSIDVCRHGINISMANEKANSLSSSLFSHRKNSSLIT